MFPTSRRVLLGAAASAAAGLISSRSANAQGRMPTPRPVRIGCLVALSGAQEVLGRPILDGAQIAADQLNETGGVLGRPVEIVPFDVHADPKTAVAGVRELTGLGVNLLCGVLSSDVGLALAPLLRPTDAVLITCAAASEKLTHEAFTPNLFRITDQTYMRNRAQARLMAERYPEVTRWGAIIPDVEYGRSAYASFRAGLLEAYPAIAGRTPELVEPVVARFGETDFRQQLAVLRAGGAKGLFIAVYGDDAIGFYRQARLAGLMRGVKVLADATNEFLVPLSLGTGTPEHLWLGMSWYYGGYQKLAMGKALHDDYLKRTGNGLPLGFLNAGHSAIYAYAAAIRKAGNTDTKPVIAALEGLTFETAKGTVTLRPEDHQAICDVNFIRIKASEAEPTMDILDYSRPDIEVAEFVRYDGASVIEPPTPGRPVVYLSKL